MDCFIIMPISTPESALTQYGDDQDHFKHVLDHLFVPAVKQAEMNPIPPIARGADIIQGEIIKHLESADLVLCDMSTLNPNVFFEMGIRTAVNKPVSLVRDDATPHIPFDTQIINHHTYSSSLAPWKLDNEVRRLKEHLKACAERSDAGNTLWRYFSLSSQAAPLQVEPGLEGKVDFLTVQVEALRQDLRRPELSRLQERDGPMRDKEVDELFTRIRRALRGRGISEQQTMYDPLLHQMVITTSPGLPELLRRELIEWAGLCGVHLKLKTGKPVARGTDE